MGTEDIDEPGRRGLLTGSPEPYLNLVLRTDLSIADAPRAIARLRARAADEAATR